MFHPIVPEKVLVDQILISLSICRLLTWLRSSVSHVSYTFPDIPDPDSFVERS